MKHPTIARCKSPRHLCWGAEFRIQQQLLKFDALVARVENSAGIDAASASPLPVSWMLLLPATLPGRSSKISGQLREVSGPLAILPSSFARNVYRLEELFLSFLRLTSCLGKAPPLCARSLSFCAFSSRCPVTSIRFCLLAL